MKINKKENITMDNNKNIKLLNLKLKKIKIKNNAIIIEKFLILFFNLS
jgi:hypothetical protein|tara:strand:+ start:496 stop:639 length:144 start_codon:yes stop_codon:yes gene_type:complete